MPLTDTKVRNTNRLKKEYKLTDNFSMSLHATSKVSQY